MVSSLVKGRQRVFFKPVLYKAPGNKKLNDIIIKYGKDTLNEEILLEISFKGKSFTLVMINIMFTLSNNVQASHNFIYSTVLVFKIL